MARAVVERLEDSDGRCRCQMTGFQAPAHLPSECTAVFGRCIRCQQRGHELEGTRAGPVTSTLESSVASSNLGTSVRERDQHGGRNRRRNCVASAQQRHLRAIVHGPGPTPELSRCREPGCSIAVPCRAQKATLFGRTRYAEDALMARLSTSPTSASRKESQRGGAERGLEASDVGVPARHCKQLYILAA